MNWLREIPSDYLQCCPVIDDKYKVLFKLGSGRFSKYLGFKYRVKMGLRLATNQRVAIKIMNERPSERNGKKSQEKEAIEAFLSEIKMCAKSKHRNVIQVLDFNVAGVCRTSDGQATKILYYVMNIAQNGELFRIIKEPELLSEKAARFIFRQLVELLEHLHQNGVAHCDIKAENVLLDKKLAIKLADFGCSRFFLDETCNKIQFLSSNAGGSTKSNAPELTNHEHEGSYHADEVDLFACGCLLFEMVMKAQPFKSSDYKDPCYQQLINDKLKFWKIFENTFCPSEDFKDMIERLLDPNPKIRLSIDGVRKHPWYLSEPASVKEYRKDLTSKMKRVAVKVRKEQEQEIKNFFKKERSKLKEELIKWQQISLPIELEIEFGKEIFELYEILRTRQNNKSQSSSNLDPKEQEERKNLL